MNLLRKHSGSLRLLSKAKPFLKKAVLKNAGPELAKCICDCALTILNGNVSLSRAQKQKLRQYKKALRKLAHQKITLKSNSILVQIGGFLSVILSAIASLVGALATN